MFIGKPVHRAKKNFYQNAKHEDMPMITISPVYRKFVMLQSTNYLYMRLAGYHYCLQNIV